MESFIQNRFIVLNIIVTLTGFFVQVTTILGKTRLTQVPSILYVSTGGTARFVWNYTVDNRAEEFQLSSPKWTFINENNTQFDIGFEEALHGWKWFINKKTCPPRLLNPNRVNKESIATLVIFNVTTADSGVYEFILLRKTKQPIRSKAQLIVTTKPTFNQFSNKAIVEGENLGINCSATGIPTPNITWVSQGIANEIKSKGIGHAYLVIQNISRQEGGTYTCEATNNPNEVPVIKETQVTVLYKPHFFNSTIFNKGKKITLRCLVRGQPAPVITWYDPFGKKISSGTRNITGGNELTLETTNISGYIFGQYTCNATNEVGYQIHLISVTRKYFPTSKPLITEIEKQVPTTSKVNKNESEGENKRVKELKMNIVFAIVPCLVASFLITIFVILVIKLRRRYQPNEDDKEVTRENENDHDATDTQPSVTQAEEGGMAIYAQVNLSKKRKNTQKDDKPIYAQVDLSKKRQNRQRDEKPLYGQVDFSKKRENRQEDSMPIYAQVGLSKNMKNRREDSSPIYAQVNLSKKRKNRQENIKPIHAQVEKSKKKRPSQILYAELDNSKLREEIPCAILQSACSTTDYADVDIVPKKSVDDSELIYETLPKS